jgi:hypothetical protein
VGHDGDDVRRAEGRRLGAPIRGAGPERKDDVVLWIALAVDTALAIVDALTPVVLINLLIFGPLVAAFRARPRPTALVAVYALALALYEGIPHGIFGSSDHVVRCAAIAARASSRSGARGSASAPPAPRRARRCSLARTRC